VWVSCVIVQLYCMHAAMGAKAEVRCLFVQDFNGRPNSVAPFQKTC
jgi:hypothetical protein